MKTPPEQKLARQRKRRRELARFRFPWRGPRRSGLAMPLPLPAYVSNPCITEEELFLACGLTAERIRQVLEKGAVDPPPDPARANELKIDD